MMNHTATHYLTADLKISDVVLDFPLIMLLMEHFGIYVPLQEKTIREICEENNLNPEVFLTFANLYCGFNTDSRVHFSYNEIQAIIGFLKKSHIFYKEEMFPEIRGIIKQMYEVNNQQEMVLVEKFFKEYFNEVIEHLNYEDTIVFPYTTGLHGHILNRTPVEQPFTCSMNEYKAHHNDIEEKLTDLKNLLVKYLPFNNDQKIRRNLVFKLIELEHDLGIHAKIEDMILVPLVEQMEHLLNDRR